MDEFEQICENLLDKAANGIITQTELINRLNKLPPRNRTDLTKEVLQIQLLRCVNKEISISFFEIWLSDYSWKIISNQDHSLNGLISEISLLIWECGDGYRSQENLLEEFDKLC